MALGGVTKGSSRIYLSPPHLGGEEGAMLQDAVASNWIAPVGPHVDAFEQEFAAYTRARWALALSSGTAALHLGLHHLGVARGDEVIVSSLTFVASANPILYLGATPVFVDSETRSWNMDPQLLACALDRRARRGRLPKAVVVVHLYGQCADMDPILDACRWYGVPVIEDAAEALGSDHRGAPAGTMGLAGVFSFNGNKIITTSGGGMLVSDEANLIEIARKRSCQSREPAPHYEHAELGFNYRLSNLLAAVGRAQMHTLEDRIKARRQNFAFYQAALAELPGVEFMPEAEWGRHTRWLTALTIDPDAFGADREQVRLALEQEAIEARPVWKPMHRQPLFSECEAIGGTVADRLFERGLCLPSGSNLRREDLDRITTVIRSVHDQASR